MVAWCISRAFNRCQNILRTLLLVTPPVRGFIRLAVLDRAIESKAKYVQCHDIKLHNC